MPVTTYTTTAATLPAHLIDAATGHPIVYAVFDKAPAMNSLLIYENTHYRVIRFELIEQKGASTLRVYVRPVEESQVKIADHLQPTCNRGRAREFR